MDSPISQLPAVGNVGGADLVPIVQAGVTSQATVAQLQSGMVPQLVDYAALRAYAGPAKSVYVTGYLVTAAPSGIAGQFTTDTSDITTADNGGTVIVDASNRRWKRNYSGNVQAAWFGTGVNNTPAANTTALQGAINYAYTTYVVVNGYASGGAVVELPAERLRFNEIMRKNGVSLHGKGRYRSLLMMAQNGGTGFRCAAADSQSAADNVYWLEDSNFSMIPDPGTTFSAHTILWNMIGFSRLTWNNVALSFGNNISAVSVVGATTAGTGGPAQWYNDFNSVFVEGDGTGGVGWDLGDTDAAKEQITAWNWFGGRTSGNSGIGMRINSATGINLYGHKFEGLDDELIIGSAAGTRGCSHVSLFGCYFEGSSRGYTIYPNAVGTTLFKPFATGVTNTDNGTNTAVFDDGVKIGNYASNDPKTLDWYEEGTFTPAIAGAGTAGVNTYAQQIGRFQRIGNRVHVQVSLILSAKDAAMAGSIKITGLPYAAKAAAGSATMAVGDAYLSLDVGYTWPAARVDPGQTFIYLLECGSNKSVSNLLPANIFATTELYISGSYEV